MFALGAWEAISLEVFPLINAILGAAGRPMLDKLDL